MDANPILEILEKITSNCPENYEPLDIGEWEGTKEGCLCPDGSVLKPLECSTRKECKKVS